MIWLFICIGVLAIVFVGLVVRATIFMWCPDGPKHRHFWQNTGMSDTINRHVYLCVYCEHTSRWNQAPTYQPEFPEIDHPLELR